MIEVSAEARIEGVAPGGATNVRRQANECVRELVDAVAEDGRPRRAWTFFCECGDPRCEEMVYLPPHVFDDIVGRNEGRVLASGHRPTRATPARERARRKLRFRVELSHDELLDAAEDVERVLFESDRLDLTPAGRGLFHALDEAVSEIIVQAVRSRSAVR
jgi:hypothetical protein